MARARSSKVVKGSEGPAPRTVLKLALAGETVRWLKVQALGRGCSVADVVDELVRSSPTEYVLTRRSVGAQVSPGPAVPGPQEARQGPPALGIVSGEVRGREAS